MEIPPNLFLSSLPPADFDALRPHLRAVELRQSDVLHEIGSPIEKVHFPHNGIVSLVIDLASGETIESAMIGRESVVGGSSGLNSNLSVCKAIVQIAGAGSVMAAEHLRALAESGAACRASLFRHEQMILV